jgi:hemerythrin
MEPHLNEHDKILAQLVEFNFAAIDRPTKLTRKIVSQIRKWLVDHDMEYDMNIKKYLPLTSPH